MPHANVDWGFMCGGVPRIIYSLLLLILIDVGGDDDAMADAELPSFNSISICVPKIRSQIASIYSRLMLRGPNEIFFLSIPSNPIQSISTIIIISN